MNKKSWLIIAGTFLLFAALALVVLIAGHARGGDRPILAGGLLLLGALAAVLVWLLLSARARGAGTAPARGADDVVDAALAAARARLGGAARLRGSRAVLVLGPQASAKTTIVTESGLAPELIAGEARRDGAVVPTGVNIWYAQDTVLAEAGGALLEDPARWKRLLRQLRPRRLAAALGGKAQAPRSVILCFPCDELVSPGAAQSAVARARQLRERLLQAAHELGMRLPVYVLFTRADRFPHFTEYVRSLSQAEAQEVLGTTLPPLPAAAAALYAEQEAQRLGWSVRMLLQSLAMRRIDLLGRESEESVRQAAYELPRELRKVSDLLVQVLVELTRPSHLGTSPFLRGFYFTGVRPLVVEDAAAASPGAAARPTGALDATGVFDPRLLQAQAAAAAAPRGTRRIPDWTYLRRLFTEVVLADAAAMKATAGGARVNALRRIALAAATLAGLVFTVGFTVSYANNRGLERLALSAAQSVQALDAAALAEPTPAALQRLDTLGRLIGRLRAYELTHPPMRGRWGLYTGAGVLPELRRVYFQAFDAALWRGTRANLAAYLHTLPSGPDAATQYGPVYDALKAHLVTTSHAEASTATFLAPVLMRYWRPLGGADAARADLARRQFELFGAELPHGNPFKDAPDQATVAQAQAFLQQFGDVQRLYAALVAEASDSAPAIQFSRLAPAAAPVVRNDVLVPGAFTKPGWAFVQRRLKDVNRLFERDAWVVGPAAVAPAERTRMAQELKAQYAADYARHWQAYLAGASVGGMGGAEQSARTLARLSDPSSPLLQLLAIASVNTAVDSTVVRPAFQPVHAVVPPGATDKFVADANRPYVQALVGVQAAMAQVVAASGPARAGAVQQLTTAADQANAAVLQLAQAFNVSEAARPAGDEVRRLLQAPLAGIGGLSAALPVADLNGKGEAFCRQLGRVLSKYPFNARGADASMDEVQQLFAPGGNAFGTFFEGGLQDVLVKQGSRYAAKLGATPQPTAAFVAFFNRAAEISGALYEADGSGPHVVFVLRPQTSADIPEVSVAIDGQTQATTRTAAAARTFEWDGTRAHDARITAKVRGTDVVLQAPPGSWALFRLLQQADWQLQPGGRSQLKWHLPQGVDLAAEITFAKGVPVFSQGFMGGFRCAPEVAR